MHLLLNGVLVKADTQLNDEGRTTVLPKFYLLLTVVHFLPRICMIRMLPLTPKYLLTMKSLIDVLLPHLRTSKDLIYSTSLAKRPYFRAFDTAQIAWKV